MLPRLIPIILFSFALTPLTSCEGDSAGPPSQATPDSNIHQEDGATPDTESSDTAAPLPDHLSVCDPNCENRECGDDGCGGNCGVCDPQRKCDDDGQCVDVCLSQADTLCVGQAVYWVDGCGETEEIKETCSTGTQCEEGTCIPCTANASVGCHEGALYHFDDCGNPGALMEDCEEGFVCFDEACVPDSSPYSGNYVLVVEPTVSTETISGEVVTASFPALELTLDIGPDGTATMEFTGPGVSFDGVGSLVDNKLMAGCEFEEMDNGHLLIHKTSLTALFIDEGNFSGTLNDLVFLENEEGIPASILRELNASKVGAGTP